MIGEEVYGTAGPSPVRCHDPTYQNAQQSLDAQRADWVATAVANIPQGVALHAPIVGPAGAPIDAPLVLQHADGFHITVVPVSLAAGQGLNSGSASTGVPSFSNVQINGSPGGCTMQDHAPKASATVAGDYYFNQLNNLHGLNGIHFTFSTPVRAFGTFWGDTETSLRGTTAFMRLLDESGNLLGDVPILSTIGSTGGIAAEDAACSQTNVADAQVTSQGLHPGCGNGSTRWIGFVTDTPVAEALVVVGDNDPLPDGQGLAEKLSFMGATVVRQLAPADLAVTKVAPDRVVMGEPFNYTITVSNPGSSLAAGLILTDTAPTGISFDAVSGSGCQLTDNEVRCTAETLAAGGSTTILIRATARSTATVTNRAVISAANDSNVANNSADASVTPDPAPPNNFCVEAGSSGGPALIINEVLYNEAGSSGDEWVELYATTAIPAGAQFLLSDDEAGASRFERLLSAPAGGIPAGTYIVIHDDAGVDDLDPSDGVMSLWGAGISNPGSVHLRNSSDNLTLYEGANAIEANAIDYMRYGSDTTDSTNDAPPAPVLWGGFAPGGAANEQSVARSQNGADGSSGNDWVLSGDDGTIGPSTPGAHNSGLVACNVAVSKTGPSTALMGSAFDYSITISNTTNITITNVVITDTAPAGIQFQNVDGPSCHLDDGEIRCAIGTLVPGASYPISVSAIATQTGVITNTVQVGASGDGTPADNSATHATTVQAPGSVGDYVYLDTNGNGIQDPGETTPINGARVTLTAADGITATLGSTATAVDGLYRFESLPPGTYTVTVEPPPGFVLTGPAAYVVTVGSGEQFTDADFGFQYEPVDVRVEKSAPTSAVVSGTVPYTFTVTNPSPTTTALDVTLIDTHPAGLLFTEIADPRCALLDDGLACHLGHLAPLETIVISATGRAVAAGSWTNSVEITGTNESGGADNRASATTEVVAPALRVEKMVVSPANGVAAAGEVVTFSLRIENRSAISVTELQLNDTFDPAYLQYRAADPPASDATARETGVLTWTLSAPTPPLPLRAGGVMTVTVEFTATMP